MHSILFSIVQAVLVRSPLSAPSQVPVLRARLLRLPGEHGAVAVLPAPATRMTLLDLFRMTFDEMLEGLRSEGLECPCHLEHNAAEECDVRRAQALSKLCAVRPFPARASLPLPRVAEDQQLLSARSRSRWIFF